MTKDELERFAPLMKALTALIDAFLALPEDFRKTILEASQESRRANRN